MQAGVITTHPVTGILVKRLDVGTTADTYLIRAVIFSLCFILIFGYLFIDGATG